MAKTENAKKFSLIAAICYTIYALYNIIKPNYLCFQF